MANSIRSEIAEIYAVSGYSVVDNPTTMTLTATRSLDGRRQEVAIAFPLEITPRVHQEQILKDIAAWKPDGRDRIFVVALPKSLSLGAEFQSQVTGKGGKLRHYAGILDGGYGGEFIGLGSEDHHAIDDLRDRLVNYSRVDADLLSAVVRPNLAKQALVHAPTRVQQRYFIRDGIGPSDRRPNEGVDLLHHLIARLGQPPSGPEVYLIIGPGGSGKTWLFEGLFTYLDEAFQRRKQQQEPGVRPTAVMPDSLIRAGSRKTEALFKAVAETEFGIAGLGLLDHLVRRGQLILMFDGLDEFFADSEDIGRSIVQRYLSADSRSRIFIVLRDSLLETSPNVRNMAQQFARLRPDGFSIYEIAMWDRDFAQRELAWLKLERRRPRPSEQDTPLVAGFLAWLASSPRMQDLARLAFYCDLLADLYAQHLSGATVEDRSGRPIPEDEYDLLQLCLDLIVDRELAKQRPDETQAPENAFVPIKEGDHKDGFFESLRLLFKVGAKEWLRLLESRQQRETLSPFAIQSSGGDLEPAGSMFAGPLLAGPRPGAPEIAYGRLGLVQLIEEAAYFARRKPEVAGLTPASLRQLYEGAKMGLTEDDRVLGERMLRQFVLFVQGSKSGTVDFTHEFMADFLAARHVVARVRAGNGKLHQLVGRPVHGETAVFQGYLARELGPS